MKRTIAAVLTASALLPAWTAAHAQDCRAIAEAFAKAEADPGNSNYIGLYGAQKRCQERARDEARRASEAQSAQDQFRKRVGGLIAAGDCDAALKEVLAAGDFDLADRVKQYCPAQGAAR